MSLSPVKLAYTEVCFLMQSNPAQLNLFKSLLKQKKLIDGNDQIKEDHEHTLACMLMGSLLFLLSHRKFSTDEEKERLAIIDHLLLALGKMIRVNSSSGEIKEEAYSKNILAHAESVEEYQVFKKNFGKFLHDYGPTHPHDVVLVIEGGLIAIGKPCKEEKEMGAGWKKIKALLGKIIMSGKVSEPGPVNHQAPKSIHKEEKKKEKKPLPVNIANDPIMHQSSTSKRQKS